MTVKLPLTPGDLQEHLARQLSYLERSADAFDNGFEDEAQRMAVSIRVLVHDTNSSTSLLKQLGKLPRQQFVDSAIPQAPGTVGSYSGLFCVTAGPNGGKFVPHLDDAQGAPRQVDFGAWWVQPIFVYQSGRKVTRKEVVLTAANQDGGAHVDPALDAGYAELTQQNALGWFTASDAKDFTSIKGPERAAIRQIAHEVLKTLKPGYGKKIERQGLSIAPVGIRLNFADQPPPNKMGRNDRCYCGSGKKYKHCHGRPV